MIEKKRLLMAEPSGGLCNRLICINNTIHLLKLMPNLRICIVWWKEPECGCRYEDILKPIEGMVIKNFSRPLKTRKRLLKEKKYFTLFLSCFQKYFFDFYYRSGNPNRIGSFWEIGEGVTEEGLISKIGTFRSRAIIFHRMGVEYRTDCVLSENYFSDAVIKKLTNRKRKLEGKEYVGLHIRRKDNKHAIQNSPIKFFMDAIERELESSKEAYFYLATDDEKVKEILTDIYGECILFDNNGESGRLTSKAIQNAAVDLLMLAGAKRIYGSAGSTFSEMAAQIGKRPLILELSKEN